MTESSMLTLHADVVVLGAGGAGLPAAVQAQENGARRVVVLEKRPSVGGNAVFANGIFACESPVQRRYQVDIDRDDLFREAMAWHHYDRVDARVLRAYIDKSGDTIAWLMSKGIEFEVGPQMGMYPGQPPSWHIAINKKTGDLSRFAQVFRLLQKECVDNGGQLMMQVATQTVLKDEQGRVCGVQAVNKEGQTVRVLAPAVVLACGGFIGNTEMLRQYFSYFDEAAFGGFYVPMMGDGIKLAEAAGAALEPHATLVKETPASSDEMEERSLSMVCREPDIMWVNRQGRRFADESIGAHLQTSANAILHQPGKVAFTVFDQGMIDRARAQGWTLPKYPAGDWHEKFGEQLAAAAAKGEWAYSAESIEELATWMGADPQVLRDSVDEYNAFCARGHDATFAKHRKHLRPVVQGPFHVVRFGALMIETVGPVRVNERMEVLDPDYDAIPGLFAAGAMAAGWQGHDYCGDLMFGSALGFAMSSGRIAGEQAASYAAAHAAPAAPTV